MRVGQLTGGKGAQGLVGHGQEAGIILRSAGIRTDSKGISYVMRFIFLKIVLGAGWRRTRRGHDGETVGRLVWSPRQKLEAAEEAWM